MPRSKKSDQSQTHNENKEIRGLLSETQEQKNTISSSTTNNTNRIFLEENRIYKMIDSVSRSIYKIIGPDPIGNKPEILNYIIMRIKLKYNISDDKIQDKTEDIKKETLYSIYTNIADVVTSRSRLTPIGINFINFEVLDILSEAIYTKVFNEDNNQ